MNIAIDGRWIFREVFGIASYTRDLIANLAEIDEKNNYTIFFNEKDIMERTMVETDIPNHANFRTMLVPFGPFSIQNQLILPGILKKNNINIYHSTNYMIPMLAFPRNVLGKTACIATIHDVIPLIFPDHAPKSKKSRLYPIYKLLMFEIGARCDAIIADSEASAADVIKHLHIPVKHHNKVHAVYCGINSRFKPENNKTANREKRLLYVGRIDPYKNLDTLIRAFANVRDQFSAPVTLTIAGSTDPRYPETPRLVNSLGLDNAVKWTGYVSNEELLSLYRQADILVHPSRYEGFGLQLVEAMACGTPVICATGGSQPEVAGNAARILDPDDLCGFTDAILKILSDPVTSAEMREKGIRRAAEFTWKKTAQKTLEIYEQFSSQLVRN